MKRSLTTIYISLAFICLTGYSQNHKALINSVEKDNLEEFILHADSLDDVNIKLNNGYTLLNYSIKNERMEFIEYLLSRNVDLEKTNRTKTPLMYAVRYNYEILELLLQNGADVNRLYRGRTALSIAMRSGKNDAVNLLLSYGATIELKDGPDGPYICYYPDIDSSKIISVTETNQLIVHDVYSMPNKIYVYTPLENDSFLVSIKEPEVDTQCIYQKPDKIFAMSDIEGNYIDFIKILINNNIIDTSLNWCFGEGHLVLAGDFVDRGKYVSQVLWLIYKLEQEAQEQGGKVHFLLGNHELLDLLGLYGNVDFKYHALAHKSNIDLQEFYGIHSFFGQWLRTKNVIEKVGNIIFVHAGISDSLFQAHLSFTEINTFARKNFNKKKSDWDINARLVLDNFGVLWHRGFVRDYKYYDKTTPESLDRILSFYDATHVVIGHSMVDDISTDYAGKVVRIDVDHYENSSSGVLIKGNNIYKTTKSGEKMLIFE